MKVVFKWFKNSSEEKSGDQQSQVGKDTQNSCRGQVEPEHLGQIGRQLREKGEPNPTLMIMHPVASCMLVCLYVRTHMTKRFLHMWSCSRAMSEPRGVWRTLSRESPAPECPSQSPPTWDWSSASCSDPQTETISTKPSGSPSRGGRCCCWSKIMNWVCNWRSCGGRKHYTHDCRSAIGCSCMKSSRRIYRSPRKSIVHCHRLIRSSGAEYGPW